MKGKHTALIEVGHQLARVTPAELVADHLASQLSYTANSVRRGGPLGHRLVRRTVRLWRRDDGGNLVVPTGLANLVAEELTKAGVAVTVTDTRRFDEKAVPNAELLGVVPDEDKVVLSRVAGEPRGQLLVGSEAQTLHFVIPICRLFPRARVLVAVNGSRSRLREFRRRLAAAHGGRFDLLHHYGWPWEGGRLVGTLQDLDRHKSLDFEVVIVVDALAAVAPRHGRALIQRAGQRLYGILKQGQRPSPRMVLDLHAVFGRVLYPVPDPRGTPAAVSVLWCRPPWTPPVSDVTALERKRLLYWANDKRNDLLARVAAAIRAGDMKSVWEQGLLLGDGTEVGVSEGRVPSVTVLVESTEHGRELLRRMPGWRMLDAVPRPDGNPTPPADPFRPMDRTVLTYVAASRLAALDTHVLVSGGPEWPLALDAFPARPPRTTERVLLVEVADDVDAQARAAVRRRFHSYVERGWSCTGTPSWVVRDGDRAGRPSGALPRCRSRPATDDLAGGGQEGHPGLAGVGRR
jgi:hypothetical protein